jgi:hypothetical protein
MLEIENAPGAECDQAEKREQLVTPLHESDVGGGDSHCQSRSAGKRLCARPILARLRHHGEADRAHHS